MHWSLLFRRAAATGALTLMLHAAGAPARAEPPVDVPAGQRIVDDSGALDDEPTLEEQIQELSAEEGMSLTAVFVDTFTDPSDAGDWAEQTAELNGLASSDALLVVATEDREARFSASSEGPLSTSDQEQIYREHISPALSQEDWDGAVSGTVEGIETSLGSPTTGGAGSGPGLGAVIILVVAVLGFAIPFLILLASKRRRRRAGDTDRSAQTNQQQPQVPYADVPVAELRTRAGELIVAVDNAIQHSEQELAFARLQYGQTQTEPFERAVGEAREHMRACFALQQQLDDHIPDTEQQQRSWLAEIIGRCQDARRPLQEQEQSFNELRHLETRAPEAIADLQRESAAVRPQLTGAEDRLRQLAERYAEAALRPISDNIDQARDRLDFADSAAGHAQAELDAGDASAAVVAIRAGEEGAGQAAGLLEAVRHAAEGLAGAEEALHDAVAIAQRDIAEAQALAREGDGRQLAGAAAGVGAVLATIQEQMAAGRIDPVALNHRLSLAKEELDRGLGGIRSQFERERAAREQLDRAVVVARGQIQTTNEYIWARRGGVAAEARTRQAEAERALGLAADQRESAPEAGLSDARRASRMTEQALEMARGDVEGFSSRGDAWGAPGGFSGRGMQSPRYSGASSTGALLGGILLGGVLSGGSGGGFGGGGFGGGGGGGGFGGGFGGGGFGGDIGGQF